MSDYIKPIKYDDKTGFNLGWDWYGYGLKYPSLEIPCASFKQGYESAKSRSIDIGTHDRFVRKFMNLRLNAWRRGRLFSGQLTIQYLKDIDTDICPITLTKLDHGNEHNIELNWSVDRICNDSGYAPGNLMVMSTKANQSKSDKSYEEIFRIAYDDKLTKSGSYDGLTTAEWRRLALICSSVCKIDSEDISESGFGYALCPCVCFLPKNVVMNPSIAIQTIIAFKAYGVGNLYDKVTARFNKAIKKEMNLLMNDCKKLIIRNRLDPLDVWVTPRLFKRFIEIYEKLGKEEKIFIMDRMHTKEKVGFEIFPSKEEWGSESNGYLTGGMAL